MPDTPGFIVRSGKLFQCGSYPDKAFDLDESEMDAAISAFSPAPLDVEHFPTVFDGKLGQVLAVQRDGKELRGDVAIPVWLHEVLGPEPIKISTAWDRTTKTLKGLALVRNPRVTDAALMAAFASRHDTPPGQWAMQELHDTAARHGAVCKKPGANMASRHEANAIQQVHDLTTEHGAECQSGGRSALYSGDSPPRECGDGDPAREEREKENGIMALTWDKVKAFFAEHGIQPPEDAGEKKTETPPPAANNAGAAVFHAELERQKAEIARLTQQTESERERRIASEAVAFAEGEITASRALPYERPNLVAAYVQAARDDHAAPVQVTFAVGSEAKQGSRVEALRAMHASRRAHTLTTEAIFGLPGADQPKSPAEKEDDAVVAAVREQAQRAAERAAARNGGKQNG